MGRLSKSLAKRMSRNGDKPHDPVVGATICKNLKKHRWGMLQKGVSAQDGVVTWQDYEGCIRCGLPKP